MISSENPVTQEAASSLAEMKQSDYQTSETLGPKEMGILLTNSMLCEGKDTGQQEASRGTCLLESDLIQL